MLEALPTTARRQEENPVLDFSEDHRVDHEAEFLGAPPGGHARLRTRVAGFLTMHIEQAASYACGRR